MISIWRALVGTSTASPELRDSFSSATSGSLVATSEIVAPQELPNKVPLLADFNGAQTGSRTASSVKRARWTHLMSCFPWLKLLAWILVIAIFVLWFCWMRGRPRYGAANPAWFEDYLKAYRRWESLVIVVIFTCIRILVGVRTLGATVGGLLRSIHAGLFSASVVWLILLPGDRILAQTNALIAFLIVMAFIFGIPALFFACIFTVCNLRRQAKRDMDREQLVFQDTNRLPNFRALCTSASLGAVCGICGMYLFVDDHVQENIAYALEHGLGYQSGWGRICCDIVVCLLAGFAFQYSSMPECADIFWKDDISSWENVALLPQGGEEYQHVYEYVNKAGERWKNYDFDLVLVNMYRVFLDPARPDLAERPYLELDGNPQTAAASTRRLFHGKSRTEARGIVSDGYPPLGADGGEASSQRGIYFNDSPHESWKNAKTVVGSSPLVLISRVELGYAYKTEQDSSPTPAGQRPDAAAQFQSIIRMPGERGGVHDITVLDHRQARVEYILEFREAKDADETRIGASSAAVSTAA